MPNGPKNVAEKIERMLNVWHTLAPDKSFAGMTLAQFEATPAPPFESRRRIEDLDDQRAAATASRDDADKVSNAKAQQVVAGALADPARGPDSPLYGAFGYMRQSEYKSGLTRPRRSETPQT